jgi:hypothetical protein
VSITALAQRFPLDRLVAAVAEAKSLVREKLGGLEAVSEAGVLLAELFSRDWDAFQAAVATRR